jgi:hypothetical protein
VALFQQQQADINRSHRTNTVRPHLPRLFPFSLSLGVVLGLACCDAPRRDSSQQPPQNNHCSAPCRNHHGRGRSNKASK